MQPLFTVVIIACNVGKYLRRCVDSVLSQTFVGFDVLIGVETSDDDTLEIAKSCAEKDLRVKIFELERSGSASRIRNTGIDRADGKYVLFVDGDDWIEPDSLSKFSEKIAEFSSPDLVPAAAQIWWENPDGSLSKGDGIFKGSYPDAVMTGQTYLEKVCSINRLRTATWMNCYRIAFLRAQKLYQCDGRRHQDDEWTPRVFFAAKTVAPLKFAWYNYRIRKGSVTTKLNPKSMRDVSDNIRSFFDFWRDHKFPPALKKSFSTWYLDYTYRFFVAHSVARYDRALRRDCFMSAVGNPKQFATFKDMVRNASASKKLLLPIYSIARRKNLFRIAEILFNMIYAPIVFKIWPKIAAFTGRGK